MWWNDAELKNYNEVAVYYKGCRNPLKGKPFRSWGRIFLEHDGSFRFSLDNKDIGVLTPDNVFTFTMDNKTARSCSVTLSQSLYRALPFMWNRMSKGRYRVIHTDKCRKHETQPSWLDWQHVKKESPEYFEGIQFNLLTGECLNRRPDVLTRIDADKRISWLRSLRKFKNTIKTMAKLGAFDKAVAKGRSVNLNTIKIPDWAEEEALNKLYEGIRDNKCDTELMEALALYGIYTTYWLKDRTPYQIILTSIESICTSHSIDLRRKFGVFIEESFYHESGGESNQLSQGEENPIDSTKDSRPLPA